MKLRSVESKANRSRVAKWDGVGGNVGGKSFSKASNNNVPNVSGFVQRDIKACQAHRQKKRKRIEKARKETLNQQKKRRKECYEEEEGQEEVRQTLLTTRWWNKRDRKDPNRCCVAVVVARSDSLGPEKDEQDKDIQWEGKREQ